MLTIDVHDLINSFNLGISHGVLIEADSGEPAGRAFTLGLFFIDISFIYFYNKEEDE